MAQPNSLKAFSLPENIFPSKLFYAKKFIYMEPNTALMKIQICYCLEKVSEKFSDLYLMKVQIFFFFRKKFRFIFNENTDLFFFKFQENR